MLKVRREQLLEQVQRKWPVVRQLTPCRVEQPLEQERVLESVRPLDTSPLTLQELELEPEEPEDTVHPPGGPRSE